jgi:hypothetical protein
VKSVNIYKLAEISDAETKLLDTCTRFLQKPKTAVELMIVGFAGQEPAKDLTNLLLRARASDSLDPLRQFTCCCIGFFAV